MLKKAQTKPNYKNDETLINGPDYAQAVKPYYVAAIILTLIICIKTYAYATTGSASMLASVIDSIGDCFISCFAFLSIKLSLKPADKHHRFGHGKAEGFSALLQACFLTGASVFLVFEVLNRLFTPSPVTNHELGILVSCITIALTLVLIFFQKRAYSAAPLMALKADQLHYKSDVLLNCAVIIALVIDMNDGFRFADHIISIGIALYILNTAKQIGGEAVDMLMDKEIDEESRNKIIEIVNSDERVHGIHDLRTRTSGMIIHISFDVELDPKLTLDVAHAITRDLDLKLLKHFPNAEIIIHKDPVGDTYDPRHRVSGLHH